MRTEEFCFDGVKSPISIGPGVDLAVEIREEFAGDHLGTLPAATRGEPCGLRAEQVAGGDAVAHVLRGPLTLGHLLQDERLEAHRGRLEIGGGRRGSFRPAGERDPAIENQGRAARKPAAHRG